MPEQDLIWAHKRFSQSDRRRGYQQFYKYYAGDQRLAYATEKFREAFGNLFKEFAENACAGVVDSLAARLKIQGWQSSLATQTTEDVPSPVEGAPTYKKVKTVDPLGEAAQNLWDRNRMDERSLDVHTEALRCGDAYVIVWPDEDMNAGIWFNEAAYIEVQYDPNRQGELLRGSKLWFDDVEEVWYLNLYLRNMIEKYHSKGKNVPTKPEGWQQRAEIVNNPYLRVPIFHFANQATCRHGESELRDIIPIQDGLNKSVMDMLIAMEFASFKQRYIIGMEVDVDEATGEPGQGSAKNYGVDRMMAIPDPEAKVGQFDATDLDQFLRVTDKFWASVARVSGTPLHYFYITSGDFPSGEAIKSAEARFVTRIEDRQKGFSPTWSDAMLFALDIEGKLADVPTDRMGRKDFKAVTLSPQWKDAAPRTESELADTAVKKQAVGIPPSQIMKELGYKDDEVMRMLEESDARAVAKSILQQKQTPDGTNPNGQPQPRPTGTQGVRR